MENNKNKLPLITSISGLALTSLEASHIKSTSGVILMGRNCDNPDQILKLTNDIKSATGDDGFPILIDQEGGRVQRLKPPNWPQYKPASELDEAGVSLQNSKIAGDLKALGINVNCTPVLDIPTKNAHDIIGDRAFSKDHSAMGRAVCEQHLKAGITPIIKHIPGHGRAHSDSHKDLPFVSASLDELKKTDFKPFKDLSDIKDAWAMTAHIIYSAIDENHPASASAKIIKDIIRKYIGFSGILVSDDIEMEALHNYGDLPNRAKAVLDAGCDLALYCGGDLDKSKKIAEFIS